MADEKQLLLSALAQAFSGHSFAPISALMRSDLVGAWFTVQQAVLDGILDPEGIADFIDHLEQGRDYNLTETIRFAFNDGLLNSFMEGEPLYSVEKSFDAQLLISDLRLLREQYQTALDQRVTLDEGLLPLLSHTKSALRILLWALIQDQECENPEVDKCWDLLRQETYLLPDFVKSCLDYFHDASRPWQQLEGSFEYCGLRLTTNQERMGVYIFCEQRSCPRDAFLNELKKLQERYDRAVARAAPSQKWRSAGALLRWLKRN